MKYLNEIFNSWLIVGYMIVMLAFIGVRGVQYHNDGVKENRQLRAQECLVLNNEGDCNEY